MEDKSEERKTTGNTKKSVRAMDRLRGRVRGEQVKIDGGERRARRSLKRRAKGEEEICDQCLAC